MIDAGRPIVQIGPGPGPRSGPAVTHVRVESFDGPLGLLLSLIESRQLDILTVSLGSLAGAYLEALAGLGSDRIGNVSGFVAVAGQLILIKSRAMLPRSPVVGPADLADDEARSGGRAAGPPAALPGLSGRRRPAPAGGRRTDRGLPARSDGRRGCRPDRGQPGSRADPRRRGAAAGARPTLRLVPPDPPAPGLVARSITIAERADVIRAALRLAPFVVLQELLQGVRDRVVLAVTFLAMLELMKRREIVVEQAEPWGPIVARRSTPSEQSAGGAGPAGPIGPIDERLGDFA